MKQNKWTENNIPDLTNKTIIITGANVGLGYVSAKVLSSKGAKIIIACRSIEKGEDAKSTILEQNPHANLRVMQLDLMDLNSIKEFAKKFTQYHKTLDILLNNAGIMTTPYNLTKDGFESQIGTNHLGHFALTGLLLDVLKKTPKSRVVTVSSMAHKNGTMDFDNFLFEKPNSYTPMKSYGRSKLSNLLFAYELQRLFEKNKIDCISVAAHPGVSNTNLARHIEDKLAFKLLRPILQLIVQEAEMGALPQIRAATDDNVKGAEYYGPNGFNEFKGYPVIVKSNAGSHNQEDAKKLWILSEKLSGIKYSF